MTILSLGPGLGYIILGWLYNIHYRAIAWYILIILVSLWGYRLYKELNFEAMSRQKKERWYEELVYFFYTFFILWTLIFLLYANESENNLNYIAIFTQIGASVVASTLLSSDRRIYQPTILTLMIPLTFYFALIGTWYGYLLTIFSMIFTWVLFYSANSSYKLLMETSYQASHDMLTGLHNRYFFINYLQETMNSLKETGRYSYLLLIDLDHFKTINDSLGHDIGDRLLQDVAMRFKFNAPIHGMIARLGGDEFIITGDDYKNLEECEREAMELSNRLISELKQIYVIDKHHLYISASIGISLIDSGHLNTNAFIKEADIAMYEVKASGRDGIFMFNLEMSKRVEYHLEIERKLHFVLDNNEISVIYQPQFNNNKQIIGAEALARWHNIKLGNVSPIDFIPIAEQTGIIIELGTYILESAFKQLRDWHDTGITLKQLSINISIRQFFHSDFIETVKKLADLHLNDQLKPQIIFEMTETILIEDLDKAIEIMNRLKQIGIRFSMDDFGTGYSSLSYLSKLPVDEIKIDRSFISQLDKDDSNRAVVVTILNMADIFNLNIVAEGVETADQFNFLAKHECDIFQGYYLSRPVSHDDFEKLYRESN